MCKSAEFVHLKESFSKLTVEEVVEYSGSWHSSCYSKATHKKSLERFKKLDETEIILPIASTSTSSHLLRSRVPDFNNEFCFFFAINLKLKNIPCIKLPPVRLALG